jgi:hypothetical protein
MRCLLSGDLVEPLATHNKIEGLSDVGGLSMGDALTSFDKDAFTSFGLQQGANAAMGEAMVKVYVSALNHLIRHRSYRFAGTKVRSTWYSPSGRGLSGPQSVPTTVAASVSTSWREPRPFCRSKLCSRSQQSICLYPIRFVVAADVVVPRTFGHCCRTFLQRTAASYHEKPRLGSAANRPSKFRKARWLASSNRKM